MRKWICLLFFLLGAASVVQAQRYAVIDSHYILDKMPAYKEAQQKLDNIANRWQDQIDTLFQQVADLNKQYSAEEVMLSESLKQQRQEEIKQLEKKAQNLQKQRFGYQGDLFEKRKELIKPIQDRIYNAVQQLAAKRMYDFILDKSAGVTVFYADPKLDKSDEILKMLGLNK